MRKLLAVPAFALLLATGLMADTVVTVPFLGNMLPANETPPTSINCTGTAIIQVHQVLDSTGALKSGSVEFTVIYKFPAANTVTGLHIHKAAAGLPGNIVIPTDINATTNSVAVDATGAGTINKQVQFGTAAGQPDVAIVQDMLANPANYYVNIHTTDFPGGAMRSQLLPAQRTVVMAQMSPLNEVPPIPGSKASAIASVRVLRALDSGGNMLSSVVTFDANYQGFPDPTTLTGFHIHNGPAGVNAGVVINTGIGAGAASVPAGSGGAGNLHYDVLVNTANATQVAVVNGLFSNPTSCCYINIHNTVNPGGEIRDQLRTTDFANIQVTMLPSNETPPIVGLNASAPSSIGIYTIRNADGSVAAGTTNFDVNARFPVTIKFTGLHIHNGPAGVAGPVTIPTDVGSNNVTTDANGNVSINRWVTSGDAAGVTTLNNLLANPATAYVNLHTTDNPGGAVRAQLGGAPVAPNATAAAPNVSTVKNLAPGTIVSIYGTNLAAFAADLSGMSPFFPAVPNGLNGVSVKIGANAAPIFYVSPGQINAEVPFETAAGNQNIVVTTSGGTSTVAATVAAVVPSIFIIDNANGIGAVVKGSDFSLITGINKVKVGDLVVIYSTGLGQTTPAVATGVLVQPPSAVSFNNTVTAAVTVDSKPATTVYSIASPSFTGLYQTAFTVPAGVSGPVPLVLSAGGNASNTVTLNVQ